MRLKDVSGFRLKAGMTEWYGNHTSSLNCYNEMLLGGETTGSECVAANVRPVRPLDDNDIGRYDCSRH